MSKLYILYDYNAELMPKSDGPSQPTSGLMEFKMFVIDSTELSSFTSTNRKCLIASAIMSLNIELVLLQ